MRDLSFICFCLLAAALTGAHSQASDSGDSGCSQCEPGALCVDLEAQWTSQLGSGRQEIHLPAAHEIVDKHAGRCRGLSHVIIRGSLTGAGSGAGSLRIATGPRHQLAPAGGSHQNGLGGLAMVGSHSQGINKAHPVRCENSAGRLPSPEAAVALCPARAPAVVVQDIDYSGAGISMTCALCSVTHAFASVFTIGPMPHVDIVLPINDTGDSAVHLVLQTLIAEGDSGPGCYLKCDQGPQCVGRDQICDGIQDCEGGANASSIDESSIFCSLLRAERSLKIRHRNFAVAAASVASLAILALLAGAAAAGLAMRRCARARAADKAQQQNLSLMDKAPLI